MPETDPSDDLEFLLAAELSSGKPTVPQPDAIPGTSKLRPSSKYGCVGAPGAGSVVSEHQS